MRASDVLFFLPFFAIGGGFVVPYADTVGKFRVPNPTEQGPARNISPSVSTQPSWPIRSILLLVAKGRRLPLPENNRTHTQTRHVEEFLWYLERRQADAKRLYNYCQMRSIRPGISWGYGGGLRGRTLRRSIDIPVCSRWGN